MRVLRTDKTLSPEQVEQILEQCDAQQRKGGTLLLHSGLTFTETLTRARLATAASAGIITGYGIGWLVFG